MTDQIVGVKAAKYVIDNDLPINDPEFKKLVFDSIDKFFPDVNIPQATRIISLARLSYSRGWMRRIEEINTVSRQK